MKEAESRLIQTEEYYNESNENKPMSDKSSLKYLVGGILWIGVGLGWLYLWATGSQEVDGLLQVMLIPVFTLGGMYFLYQYWR